MVRYSSSAVLCVPCVLCVLFGSLYAAEGALVAHWKFDGNAEDAVGKSHGKALGRAEFFDSVIGAAGQLISLNGVDAFVQVDAAPGLNVGSGDFTVSLWMLPLNVRKSEIAGKGGGAAPGWVLRLLADGTVSLETFVGGASNGILKTEAGKISAGQWYHLAAAVHRGESALYINGERSAAGEIKNGSLDNDLPMTLGKLDDDKSLFNGLLDEVRLYRGALSAERAAKLTDEGLPWLRPKESAKKPFGEKFALEPEDVLLFAGGENMWALCESGHLETLLALQGPNRFHVRNMAWAGDTVQEQWRILNFGPWARQFERTGASVIFVQFGQMESLQAGAFPIPSDFFSAYEKLLDEFAQRTQRIVVLSPPPFGPIPSFASVRERNEALERYFVHAIKKMAQKRQFLFVDLYSGLLKEGARGKGLERLFGRDGVHLSDEGHSVAAKIIVEQLGLTKGGEPTAAPAKLREAIQAKNKLWQHYWRPDNWAFLAGDRVTQASSRDHRDTRVRWFPAEMQRYPALILREEQKIEQMRREIRDTQGGKP